MEPMFEWGEREFLPWGPGGVCHYPKKAVAMSATVIEYEVVSVNSDVESLKLKLNSLGARGFVLNHTEVRDGKYVMILSKNTGRQPEEESQSSGWVDDGFVNEETSWT